MPLRLFNFKTLSKNEFRITQRNSSYASNMFYLSWTFISSQCFSLGKFKVYVASNIMSLLIIFQTDISYVLVIANVFSFFMIN